MIFLSEPYITDFMSVTYIFAITGTYHLPRNSCEFLRFGGDYLRARGARCSPGGRLQIQKRKAARRSFFMAVLQKKKLACFSVILPQKKDTDVVRVFAFLDLAERGGFEPPEPIRVQRFSRPPRSTAPASLRSFRGQGLWFGSEAEICRQRQTRWYIPASLRGWQR